MHLVWSPRLYKLINYDIIWNNQKQIKNHQRQFHVYQHRNDLSFRRIDVNVCYFIDRISFKSFKMHVARARPKIRINNLFS